MNKHNKQISNSFGKGNKTAIFVLGLLLVIQLVIYLPHVGNGFVTDDFNWLESVVRNGNVEYFRAFTSTTGFFRPMVGVSFGAQYAFHGMMPRGYGMFNLVLHMLNIILVYLVLAGWSKTRALALPATVLFALNAKAANMAIIWISGRTTLLFTFFLLLSLYLFQGTPATASRSYRFFRFFLVGVSYMGALLSKETAAAAPFFIFLFIIIRDGLNSTKENGDNAFSLKAFLNKAIFKKATLALLPFLVPLVAYFLLRFNSDAFTPFNAPGYYRYSFSPVLLLKNILEYIVRAGILDIYILVLLLVLVMIFGLKKNRLQIRWDYAVFLSGLGWYLCFLLPMLPLAARSDLYAYFPQVGLHVVFLMVVSRFSFFRPFFSSIDSGKTNKKITENKSKASEKVEKKAGLTHVRISRYQYTAIIVLFCVLIVWCGYLWTRADAAAEKARGSRSFAGELVPAVYGLQNCSRVLILDMISTNERSPSKAISHGFHPMLKLYFPSRKLTGEIVSTENWSEVKRKKAKRTARFKWDGKKLIRF